MITKLTEAQCRAAIAAGDFSPDILGASPAVVVVLTQSWCPQWNRMRGFIEEASAEEGLSCFWVEYDREPFFDEFRSWKERQLGNDQVPYLRYHRDGVLVRESNYVDKGTFMRLLGAAVE